MGWPAVTTTNNYQILKCSEGARSVVIQSIPNFTFNSSVKNQKVQLRARRVLEDFYTVVIAHCKKDVVQDHKCTQIFGKNTNMEIQNIVSYTYFAFIS
jgi:hypothetical protein